MRPPGVSITNDAHSAMLRSDKLRQALIDCGAEFGLAHHYGTFQLTDEPIDAPFVALTDALKEVGISLERFRALRPGQVWEL
jgi:hypothetical protein